MWENVLNMKEFITKAKNEYMEIGKVFCPYFDDYVYFTQRGFRHLIWKRYLGKRTVGDIVRRLKSIKYATEIIYKSGTLQEYTEDRGQYFAFISITNSNKYKIIILKDSKDQYKFLSVIPNFKTNVRNKIKKPTQKG